MPITRDEWKRGNTKDSLRNNILNLLTNEGNSAFTSHEIHDHIFGKSDESLESLVPEFRRELSIILILQDLERLGEVASQYVQNSEGKKDRYYSIP